VGGEELTEAAAQKWNILESLVGLSPQPCAEPHCSTQASKSAGQGIKDVFVTKNHV